MLTGLLSWWVHQMRELLPAGLRGGGQASATVVALGELDATTAVADIGLRRGTATRKLCRVPLDDAGIARARTVLAGRRHPARVVLRLPAGALLERDVALPLAAERDPEGVLRYEIDRLTPFGTDEVLWHFAALRRDRHQGRLHLRLFLVARASFAGVLPVLRRAGLTPAAIEAQAADGSLRRFAMAGQPGEARSQRRTIMALLGLCGALAAIAVILPFARQTIELNAVASRIAALRPRVAAVEAFRQRIARDRSGADVIEAERARTGDALQMLAVLTNVLPDGTYLDNLALSHRKLAIDGQSTAAARLIAALAADPGIRNPAFSAPVMRAPGGGDAFAIHAGMAP